MIRSLLIAILLTIPLISFTQNDSLLLNNGNVIVGEIKSMDRGVLQIETPYSDSDFKIEWDKIKEIKAKQRFLISISDGQRITGTFQSAGEGKVLINNEDGSDITVSIEEVVYINSLDDSFLSRLSASIDFGYSLTKANNQQQLNSNFRMSYLADLWSGNAYYNTLITTQDNVEDIQRNDAGLGYRYFLPKDWYTSADVTLLSNTEQSIELRTTARLGIGNYVIHTNKSYWGFGIGGAYNIEVFSPVFNEETLSDTTAPSRQSFEAYIGTELNLYDIGDLSLFTNLTVYPTVVAPEDVDPGRIRADLRFDAMYDDLFIDDFYIRAGFTVNYDNRPAEAGKETDYVFTTGFGWSW